MCEWCTLFGILRGTSYNIPSCLVYVYGCGQNHTFIGIYGVYMVFLAGKSPYIRSYTVQIYGYGQPYVCVWMWPTLCTCSNKTVGLETVRRMCVPCVVESNVANFVD